MSTCQGSLAVVMVGVSTLVNILSMSLLEMRSSTSCDPMWTGPNCTYRCNCKENKCGEQVYCVGGAACIDGYFGAACQHVDLAKEAKASQGQVNDHDKTTCTKEPRVVLTFPRLYPFTFMRLETNDSDTIVGVVVSFRKSPSSPPLPCRNLYRFEISRQVFEIHCDLDGAYRQMEINWSGSGSVCYIYISGGRNIALRSKTRAREHVLQSGPDNAVDGVDSRTSSVGACYQSKVARTFPFWTAVFSRGWMVNRILVVGRHDCCEDELQYFRVSLYNERNDGVYNYTDNGDLVGGRYHIVLPRPVYAKSIKVETRKTDPGLQLVLCQVEVYGDCPKGFYGLECTDQCDEHCTNKICHDQTGHCSKSKCPLMKYGSFCEKECGQCAGDGSCDVTTGRCTYGCLPGFSRDTCTQSCSNCRDQSVDEGGVQCSFVDGKCAHGCKDTFTGSMCHKRCGFCGGNGSCSQFNGTCHFKCLHGYAGPRCDSRLLLPSKLVYIHDSNWAVALTLCVTLAFFIAGCFVTLGLGLSKKTATLNLTESTPYCANQRYSRTASLCIPRTLEGSSATSQAIKKTSSSSRLK